MTEFRLELDPRLTNSAQSLHINAPPPSFAANPVRLPPLQPADRYQTPVPIVADSSKQPSHHSISSASELSVQIVDCSATGESRAYPDTSGDPNNDPKRLRACEACRGLKVRCEPDLSKPEGPCRRCAKAGRQCVVTVPSRKRQKKTDSRVAELEKKIDALTASLHATKSGRVDSESDDSQEDPGLIADDDERRVEPELRSTRFPGGGVPAKNRLHQIHGTPETADPSSRSGAGTPHHSPITSGQKRRRSEEAYVNTSKGSSEGRKPTSSTSSLTACTTAWKDDGPTMYPFLIPKGLKGNASSCITASQTNHNPRVYDYADVIDRRLIDAEMAALIFDRYVESMAPHMPAVVLPPGTTAAEVRKTKPVLFLAILSAGSGIAHPDVQRALAKEVMQVYSDRIICKGEKSLELIQALIVSTLWYWPPDNYEELKFYQLTHIAAVMAIDIGISRRVKPTKHRAAVGLWRDSPWRRERLSGVQSIEGKRTWLSCYFLSANVSMTTRRPNLIRWSPYMSECISTLEQSSDAYASDKVLCQWVKAQHIAEDIGLQFSMDDPFGNCSISDSKVQYSLKGFERQLEDWKSQIPQDVMSATLVLCEHVVSLYMHEIVMHVDHNVEDFRAPFTEETLKSVGHQTQEPLTSAQVNSLSVCLITIHGLFDTFLAFSLATTRTIPVFHFVRLAYAAVVLIKMYLVAATPGSELGKVFCMVDIKVEFYLDSLLEKFRASAEDNQSRPASKFLMVLVMLKTWFHGQTDGKGLIAKGSVRPRVSGSGGRTFDSLPDGSASRANRAASFHSTVPIDDSVKPFIDHSEAVNSNNMRLDYSNANTPLQLLSEVATGDTDGGHARRYNTAKGEQPTNDWYSSNNTPKPPGADYSIHYSAKPTAFMDSDDNQAALMGEIAGNSGLETAMEMTFGDGDFSSIFLEDSFFNCIDGAVNILDI